MPEPPPALVLAIDLGSSWCKAAYIDPIGTSVAAGRSYTRSIKPALRGMGGQFWAAVVDAVQLANGNLPEGSLPSAIALSCRALHGICLDDAGEEFFPTWDVILNRAAPEVQDSYSSTLWGAKNPYSVGYGMSVVSAAHWTRKHRPQEWQHIARIGALHDYIVYKMTGAWVTDPTSGPSIGYWPAEVMTFTGLPCQTFPTTLEPQSFAGGLTEGAAQAFGLPPGTPVVVGMHDGAAANWGVRAVNAGDACITLGTNFAFRPATGEQLTTRCFSYRIAPDRWAWVNNVPIASPQLDIAAELLLPDVGTMAERHHQLGALAKAAAPGCNGLLIQRALAGQEAQFRERIQSAIATSYDQGVIYRAVLEAIAYGVLDLVRAAKHDGARPHRYVAGGGSAHNIAFLRVLAALLNTPVEIGRAEAGLLGAAMAAALYSDWYATLDAAMAAMTTPHPVVDPDPDAVAYYRNIQR